jgi:hypothetical protein
VKRHLPWLLALAVVAGAVVLVWPSRRLSREPHLPVAERLPEAARAVVRTQMHSHARAMMELVATLTVLDYDAVLSSVDRALEEPRIGRPLGKGADELQLPERFYALQDELHVRLQSIRRAAVARDADALADDLAITARTCVHCHQTYLSGR